MAMLKYADAIIKSPQVEPKTWNKIRHAATPVTSVPIQSIVADFSPAKYLLTHCTIVASVDVEKNGYYIKPECSQYVNQNGDAWERKLLLATFNTFIGAQNYLEHVQIPALSKGRIIDAVARPVADNTSVYIDILVATERKHKTLIASIETGEIQTLSMGCSIKYSSCTKCGRKAEDESQLCDHIKYMKNQYFMDENGVKRIIAELCGDANDPSSNMFIEASWVKNPAFKGAVMRNIIVIDDRDHDRVAKQVETAYVARRHQSLNPLDGYLKAANVEKLSSLKTKVDALIEVKKLLKKAGIDPFDDIPEDEEPPVPEGEEEDEELIDENEDASESEESDDDQPENEGEEVPEEDEESSTEEAPEEEMSEDSIAEQGVEQAPAEEGQPAEPVEGQELPPQEGEQPQEAPVEEQGAEGVEGQEPQLDADGLPNLEQAEEAPPLDQQDPAQAEGQDPAMAEQGMDPNAAPAAPPADGGDDSFDGLVDKVKKEIRQHVIDELTKELSEKQNKAQENSENTKINQGWHSNDNLVKAFVEIYKPKTGFSNAKLASIFKMIVAGESGEDFRKHAHSNRDVIDFFEFTDRFQLIENSLNKRDYTLLRKASSDDLASLGSFVEFLNKNSVTNKQVIKRIVAKARFLKR